MAGAGGGGGGGSGGAVPPYLVLAEPPFLLLTLIRIGLGRRSGRASWRGHSECGGSGGLVRGVSPALLLLSGECLCGLTAASFGRSPVGRGAGGGTRFLPTPEMFHVAVSLPVFQLSRPEGGLAALPGTSRGPGGGADGGTEGEGRTCYSSAGFRSRCRPCGATNTKLAPRNPLKCCVCVHLRSPTRFSDLI